MSTDRKSDQEKDHIANIVKKKHERLQKKKKANAKKRAANDGRLR